MFNRITSICSTLGKKTIYALIILFFFSIITGFIDIIGIGFLAVFAVSISDPSIIIDKIPFDNLKAYLIKLDHFNLIFTFAVSIFICFLVKHMVSFLVFFLEIRLLKKLNLRFKKKIFENYLNENYEYYINNNKSDIVNTISNQVGSFLTYLYQTLSIIKELILVFLIFTAILFINWKVIICLILLMSALTLIFIKIFKKKLSNYGEKSRILEEKEIKHLNESFESIKFIKLSNKYNFFINTLTEITRKKNINEIFHFLLGKLPKIYLELIVILIFMSFVLYLFSKNGSSQEIIGVVTFLALSITRILPSFITMNNCYTNLAYFRFPFEIILNKLKNLSNFKRENQQTKNLNKENSIDEIDIKDVTFKYSENDKDVLNKINLTIKKGDFVGVIGSSGSGKSTLLNILCGLLSPSEGKVLFNKTDILNYPEVLINKISHISQDNYLIDDSIKKNIAFADTEKEISSHQLQKAIEVSNLKSVIDQLPNKEESIIGDKGSKISHGQRQRVGIARAIYFNSQILLLDESLNALDYTNEELILKNILETKNNKIIFLVSHRIESLKYCNKLLILENGTINSFGKKDEILEKNIDLKNYFKQ